MAEQQVFATKGNLILYKKALKLAALGYELLDRKRNILIRELMSLVDTAGELRGSIEDTYKPTAHSSLQISPWVLLHLMQIVSLLKQALR